MIKKILKTIVVTILQGEAKLVLKKYRPKIVGVTGSVGKTSTKDAIFRVLATTYRVRESAKSFNSEIGVPLTILGQPNAWGNIFAWLKNFVAGLELLLFKCPYPDWLILEIGADRPGDIKKLCRWLTFDVVVLTRVPEVPVHIEFFKSTAQVVAEKAALAQAVKESGVLVVNFDDPSWVGLRAKAKVPVITYGFDQGAILKASYEHLLYQEPPTRRPDGIAFKVDYEGSSLPVRLRGVIGKHQIYSALAAFGVGVSQGLNMLTMIEVLARLTPPAGRLRLITGVKESLILDDSYNASPAATAAALETLGKLETVGRKIAVLGDMLELGEHTIEAHKEIGYQAAGICDLLVAVGLRAKFILEGAAEKKFNQKKMFYFDDAVSAGEWLQNQLKANDIVLVKGSQSIRLEKCVEEIMAEPERKAELLCRQEPEWQKR